jgi:hypothetical protein
MLGLLLVTMPSEAFDWDRVKQKVDQGTRTFKEKVDQVTGANSKKNTTVTNKSERKSNSHQANQNKQETAAASDQIPIWNHPMWILVVRYHPEVVEDEESLKFLLRQVYPKEWGELEADEFARHRELPKLKDRLLREARTVSTTFRVVRSSRLQEYDFKKSQFTVPKWFLTTPKGRPQGNRYIVFDRELKRDLAVPMEVSRAEEVNKLTGSRNNIQIDMVFDVVDVVDSTSGNRGGSDKFIGSKFLAKIKSLKIYSRCNVHYDRENKRQQYAMCDEENHIYTADPNKIPGSPRFEALSGQKVEVDSISTPEPSGDGNGTMEITF